MLSQSHNPINAKSGAFPTFRRLLRVTRIEFWRAVWKRARRPLAWVFGVSLAAHIALNIWASALLNRETAAIQARSESLSVGVARPSIAANRNAALLYERAGVVLKLTPQENEIENGLSFVSARTPQSAVLRRKLLDRNREAVALTRRASTLPDCRFEVRLENGAPSSSHLFPMHSLALVLSAHAIEKANERQADAALSDVVALFRMSEHIAREKNMMAGLIAASLERLSYSTLRRVIETTPISPQQARAIEARLPTTDWKAMPVRCLQGERALGLAYLVETQREVASPPAWTPNGYKTAVPLWRHIVAPPLVAALRAPVSKLENVHFIRYYNGMIKTAQTQSAPPSPDAAPWYLPWMRDYYPVFDCAQRGFKAMLADRAMAHSTLEVYSHRA